MESEIFGQPWWKFRITEFFYECSSENYLQHYIQIGFRNGEESYRLRFDAPTQLKIEEGFPIPTHGLEIIDVRDRQLENIIVAVQDFEASQGSISFFAKGVRRIRANEIDECK